MSDTLVDVDLDRVPDVGETEPEAHIIRQDDMMASLLGGEEVTALCGKRFTVKTMQPAGIPLCKPCQDIFAAVSPPGPGNES